MTRDTHSFPLRLAAEEYEALKIYAATTDSSMNEVVRRALREFLEGTGREAEIDAIYRDARDRYGRALDKLASM